MTVSAIEMGALSFGYRGGPPVLKDLSFVVGPGERLGVVGANGAGKSTLLKLLAGVMPPDTGSLTVLGSVPRPQPWRASAGTWG